MDVSLRLVSSASTGTLLGDYIYSFDITGQKLTIISLAL
jgi:hypothetical protein